MNKFNRKSLVFNNRRPLIVDYDSTLINSVKTVCELYNEMMKVFGTDKYYPLADWTKVNKWDLSDQCTLFKEIFTANAIDLFDSEDFFDRVEFYEGAKEALKIFSELTDVTICTSGTPKNISRKVLHIEKHLPFANIVPVIIHGSNGYGKSIVNMEDAIFIDDHAGNLEGSNADIKILYGEPAKEWNKGWGGLWMNKWNESAIEYIINKINRY